MPDEFPVPNNPIEACAAASESDKAASAACTKSGTFALLLSGVLFVLLTSWMHRPSEIELARYLAYRYDLAQILERLDGNPVGGKLKTHTRISRLFLSQIPTQTSISSDAQAGHSQPSRVASESGQG
jgi:hypothetical protein